MKWSLSFKLGRPSSNSCLCVALALTEDFLKVLTEDNSYKATFILALGWGQTANDKFFSSGALIKYKHPTGKGILAELRRSAPCLLQATAHSSGIAIDYLPLINGKVPSVKGFYATPLALSESATFEEWHQDAGSQSHSKP